VVSALLGGRPHSAALIGWGSDVLGFDTERSTDHGWGPRVEVFVDASDVATRFGWDEVPVTHHVGVSELGEWLASRIGFDPRGGVATRQWLCTPQQRLLEVTAGAVFHDDGGRLESVRAALAWYPDDVWLWLLACQWRRLDQEEPFVGRAAEVGDELGSRVVAARLARDVMRLAFLLERRYAPYSKWLGSAFARLDAAATLGPALLEVVGADDYASREAALVVAVEELARRHNALGITEPVDASARLFHSRPFRVLGSGRFVDACLERVQDDWLRELPLTGGVDQISDSTDVAEDPGVLLLLKDLVSVRRLVERQPVGRQVRDTERIGVVRHQG
jgi:uncharacterized protein DUF4037